MYCQPLDLRPVDLGVCAAGVAALFCACPLLSAALEGVLSEGGPEAWPRASACDGIPCASVPCDCEAARALLLRLLWLSPGALPMLLFRLFCAPCKPVRATQLISMSEPIFGMLLHSMGLRLRCLWGALLLRLPCPPLPASVAVA